MIPLEDARRRVLSRCEPLHPKAIPLDDALGCVTSMDVVAETSVPPFANSAMDGYALKAEDTKDAPTRLRIRGTISAGDTPDITVEDGDAVRIMTGARIPDGADAIVMVELTETDDDAQEVLVKEPVPAGNHIRPAGDDIAPGDAVFSAGTVLGPAHLGVLASLGIKKVPVRPRARVGVLSTGDELVNGQIEDSNRPTLLALCRQSGFEPVDLGTARDDETEITAAIEDATQRCDAVLTTGGVSMGDFEFVKAVLGKLGEGEWMQVAIKPAKPLAFGLVDKVPVFGLPGNPVSSMVSFELFARPAIRKMMGFTSLDRPHVPAVAADDLTRRSDGKTHFARVTVEMGDDGRYRVRSSGAQGSHQLSAMAMGNGLAVLKDGMGVKAGETVTVMLL